jgi:hypothetical protein
MARLSYCPYQYLELEQLELKSGIMDKYDPHTVIPVIVDEDRTLSRQLKLFTGFWDGVTAEQNIASVFIIDKIKVCCVSNILAR